MVQIGEERPPRAYGKEKRRRTAKWFYVTVETIVPVGRNDRQKLSFATRPTKKAGTDISRNRRLNSARSRMRRSARTKARFFAMRACAAPLCFLHMPPKDPKSL